MEPVINRRKFLYQAGFGLSASFGLGLSQFFQVDSLSVPVEESSLDQTLVFYGDSLTAGAGGVPYGSLVGEYFPGRKVFTDAIGGQDSFAIVARQGGLRLYISAEGGKFNGSDLVKITQISNQFLSTKATPGTIKRKAIVAGVKCTIIRNGLTQIKGEESYHLMPDAASDVIIADDTEVTLDNAQLYKSATQILWMGRNNNVSKPGGFDEVKSCIDKAILFISEPRRYIVLGILNGLLETQETPVGKSIMSANEKLMDAYADHFVSMEPPTDDEMKEINYTPSEQERIELSKLTFPSGMRADRIHLNKMGYQIVANRVVKKVKELGY